MTKYRIVEKHKKMGDSILDTVSKKDKYDIYVCLCNILYLYLQKI
jgi:hypothetical protein